MTVDAPSHRPTPFDDLPPHKKVIPPDKTTSLRDLERHLTSAFEEAALKLDPLEVKSDDDRLSVFKTRVPMPFDGDDVDLVVVAAVGRWTEKRTDTFIANFAPLRLTAELPQFRLYSAEPIPPELTFIFETLDAGVFEISAWEVVDNVRPAAEGCEALAEAGRHLIGDFYGVELPADDLQWVAIVNQLIDEELRWFTDAPDARLPDHVDYVPYASLVLMGCVAGEALRLNHEEELMWADADGDNWPRIAQRGKTATIPIIDTVFKRFEAGRGQDVWEMYKLFYTVHQLSPPSSFDAIMVDPLEFLPSWDPEPDQDLADTTDAFEAVCAEEDLEITPHPIQPAGEAADVLGGFIRAYTCVRDEQRYDLFLCTEPWTDARSSAFLKTWGHRSMQEWEIGANPVFVFFSGHALDAMLEYCFIDGSPVAPLEGLARVETPAPEVPADPGVILPMAHWLLHALELYTTIGLDLDSDSVLPGLEFFIREELSQNTGAQAPNEDVDLDEEAELGEVYDMDHYGSYEPIALLTAVGLTAGEWVRDRAEGAATWVAGEDDWPVMELELPFMGSGVGNITFDWVAAARRVWRGETEELGLREAVEATEG